jgi:hypothetical protein
MTNCALKPRPPTGAAAWKQGVESIIETGLRLIEVRNKFFEEGDGRGKWSRLIGANQWKGQELLPFGKTHARRLVTIAEDQRLGPHVGLLPSDSYTLHKLTRLSDERFQALIEDGRIHPGMKRNEASAETRAESKAIAMAVYARQAKNKELETDAEIIRWRAENRLGELIKAQKETVGLNVGARAQLSLKLA